MLDRIIAEKIKEAMKSKDDVTKNILRLFKGETERCNGIISDDVKYGVARKMIKNNQFTIEQMISNAGNEESLSDDYKEKIVVMKKENEILKGLLPKSMDENELGIFVESTPLDLGAFTNQGQMIGAINKEVKKANVVVDIDVIRSFVEKKFKK